MRAGTLRKRITIMTPGTPTPEADGSLRPASPTEIATVWAGIEHVRGDEALRMGIQEGRTVKRLTMRYRDDLKLNMYAEFGSRTLHFQTIDQGDERKRETVVLAEERLRT